MIISENQIMGLIRFCHYLQEIMLLEISTTQHSKDSEIAYKKVEYLLNEISNQQSEELKVIE